MARSKPRKPRPRSPTAAKVTTFVTADSTTGLIVQKQQTTGAIPPPPPGYRTIAYRERWFQQVFSQPTLDYLVDDRKSDPAKPDHEIDNGRTIVTRTADPAPAEA